jgi:hypothetical protein
MAVVWFKGFMSKSSCFFGLLYNRWTQLISSWPLMEMLHCWYYFQVEVKLKPNLYTDRIHPLIYIHSSYRTEWNTTVKRCSLAYLRMILVSNHRWFFEFAACSIDEYWLGTHTSPFHLGAAVLLSEQLIQLLKHSCLTEFLLAIYRFGY